MQIISNRIREKNKFLIKKFNDRLGLILKLLKSIHSKMWLILKIFIFLTINLLDFH